MSLKVEIERYSKLNGYKATDYSEVVCPCGTKELKLFSDDDEGGAYVLCPQCNQEIDLEESRHYIEVETSNICNCDNEILTVGIGKAYHQDSHDPRWVYIGCHCKQCGLSGVYVDWKQN